MQPIRSLVLEFERLDQLKAHLDDLADSVYVDLESDTVTKVYAACFMTNQEALMHEPGRATDYKPIAPGSWGLESPSASSAPSEGAGPALGALPTPCSRYFRYKFTGG